MPPSNIRLKVLALVLLAVLAVACGSASPAPAAPPHAHAHARGHGHGSANEGRHKSPLVHRFEKADDWVPRFESADRAAWQKPSEVITLMDIADGMTVADVGAGTGYFLPYLSRAVGESGKVLALDIEEDMVRYMTERAAREHLGNVLARVVAPNDPELAPNTVDRILIVDTWHHIPDRVAYARKLADAMTPNGRLLIVDFTMQSDIGPPVAHRIGKEEIVAELRAGGLEAEAIPNALPKQYVVVGRRPTAEAQP